jgi:hypothetical protein
MDTFPFVVELEVDVGAPSVEDAVDLIRDIFGDGELKGFDVRVINMSVTPQGDLT